MTDAFLDSNVLIGLVFRNAQERAVCQAALPAASVAIRSRYVIFEVARGFLRSLIYLHNISFEFDSFAKLHQAAHSGQQRFEPYRMHTWLRAFEDYFATLEKEDGVCSEVLKLEEFRAKLRGWIRRGWRRMHGGFRLINEIGCREDLPPPTSRGDLRIDQWLPSKECGQPGACRLPAFVHLQEALVVALADGLEALPVSKKDKETLERIDGLRHLLAMEPSAGFDGKRCHRCGDALLCLEAPPRCLVVTKNAKHFEPLTQILGKLLVVVGTA